jgi:hypothetical protein
LLPSLEEHGQLKLGKGDRDLVLAISAATIDRVLGNVKIAASGGKRRRAAFYLFGDPARGSDPEVQRLERSAAGLLRGRHGRTWRHVGGGLVHPDADDGGRSHGLDRMPALDHARWLACCRSDQAHAEPIEKVDALAATDHPDPRFGPTQFVSLVVDAHVLDPGAGTNVRARAEFEQVSKPFKSSAILTTNVLLRALPL